MLSEFLTLVPETNQFHEILNKIFRKKIKRAKVCMYATRIPGDQVPCCFATCSKTSATAVGPSLQPGHSVVNDTITYVK